MSINVSKLSTLKSDNFEERYIVSVSNDGTKLAFIQSVNSPNPDIQIIVYSIDYSGSITLVRSTFPIALQHGIPYDLNSTDIDADYIQISNDGTSVIIQVNSDFGDTNGSNSNVIHFKYSETTSSWLSHNSGNRTFIDTITDIPDHLNLNGRLTTHSSAENPAKVFMNGSGTRAATFINTTPPKFLVFNIDADNGSLSFAVPTGDPRITLTGSLGSFRQMKLDSDLGYICFGAGGSELKIQKINSNGTLSDDSSITYTGEFNYIVSLSDIYMVASTSTGFHKYHIDRHSGENTTISSVEIISPDSFPGENYGSLATRDAYIVSYKENRNDTPNLLIDDVLVNGFASDIRNVLHIHNRNKIIVSTHPNDSEVTVDIYNINGVAEEEVIPLRPVVLIGSSDGPTPNHPRFLYYDNQIVTVNIPEIPIGLDIIVYPGNDGDSVPVYIHSSGGYYRNIKYTLTGDITGLNPEDFYLEAFIVNLPRINLSDAEGLIEIPLIRPTDPGHNIAPFLEFDNLPDGITYNESTKILTVDPKKFEAGTVDLNWSSYIGGRTINDKFQLRMIGKTPTLSTNAKIAIAASIGGVLVVLVVVMIVVVIALV